MILTDIQLECVRRFISPVRLEGLGAGLNVLAAPNEAGKSTVLMALRAALTLRHGSKAQAVKEMQPYGGGAPHIGVGFEWSGKSCWLEKRFMKGAFARLDLGHERFDGDTAEERLNDLLELEKNGKSEAIGLWNALLVRQGESFAAPVLNNAGRSSIQNCLEHGVQEVTGIAAAGALLERVRSRLGQLQTAATGKPTGRYKHLLEDQAKAAEHLKNLHAKRAALEEDLVLLGQQRRTLREYENPERQKQEEQKLYQLREERDRLRNLDAEEKAALARKAAAVQQFQNIRDEQERRQEHRAEYARLQQLISDSVKELSELAAQEKTASLRYQAAQAACQKALKHHQVQRAILHHVMQQREVQHQEGTLLRLRENLKHVQESFAQIEQAQAAFDALPMDGVKIQRVRKAAQKVAMLTQQVQAQATVLEMELLPHAAQRVLLDGKPCVSGKNLLHAPAELHVEGVGRFVITPSAGGDTVELQQELHQAQNALTHLLQQIGCLNAEGAEQQYEQHCLAERQLKEAKAVFAATLPDKKGVSPDKVLLELRQNLAREEAAYTQKKHALAQNLASQIGSAQASDLTCLPEKAVQQEQDAAQEVEQARQTEHDAQQVLIAAKAALDKVKAIQQQQETGLIRLQRELELWQGRESDAALLQRLQTCAQEQAEAQAALEHCEQARQKERPLAVVESGIQRLEQAQKTDGENIARLREDIRERETRVRSAEGDGVDERIAEADRLQQRLNMEVAACTRDRAALVLLDQVLRKAEQEQTARYMGPLVKTMQPAFSALFPGSELEMDADFGVAALSRNQREDVANLSDGTREQIAVLVRLGFAEMLHARGVPAILVLDDALSFADSMRLECLFDVLAEAATRFQILILTCHAQLFAPLRGRMLNLRPQESFTAPR
ncbi:GTP-binding protein [Acetobacter pomorum]|uniref:GTP-binding protein n=1 Tax=Acetobacter pomorum TaxID=65959 RepID=A0A2G4R9B1_9PROT|nr:GTP-binding protein [Acetobacter pomorum]PHY93087.1 GTP-binding protein [Acetobacter pomorum]GBR45567.1 GTP-binding protein [Acetobacter pomorum DSM 11825]